MGFFFANRKAEQAKAARKAPAQPRQAGSGGQRGVQQAAALNRLSCKACPLANEGPLVEPAVPDETLVYFLGEAPGKEEAAQETPFVGESGKLLRECIPSRYEDYCAFGNVVWHRPPNNRTPTWQEVECCRPKVTESIEQAKPKLIVAIGGIAMQWAMRTMDMQGMRGRHFAVKIGSHECWLLPIYHPAFILRTAFDKKKPLKSRMGFCFKMDMQRAFNLLEELPDAKVDSPVEAKANIDIFTGDKPDEVDKLVSLIQKARKSKKAAIDWETNCLRPYAQDAKVVSCAISFKKISFSFALDHPKAGWSKAQRKKILDALSEFLADEDCIKIAHNAPFELEWAMLLFGKEIVSHAAWEDTMMQAHFIDERRGKEGRGSDEESRKAVYQSLDFLCNKYFGLSIKNVVKVNRKKIESNSLNDLLVYGGIDAKYTLRLFQAQMKTMEDLGVVDAYYEAITRQPTVALMQHLGMDVDQDEVKKHQQSLDEKINPLVEKISSLKVVKQFEKDNRKEYNPLSNPDNLIIFRDYLKRPEIKVPKKHPMAGEDPYRYSVDKEVLAQIDHPLGKLVTELRQWRKLKSTYVDCLEYGVGSAIWPDNKIHTSFNTTFAETGRLSSDSPNMQNYDKRKNPWVRSAIVAPKGHVLLAVDYGQLEACTTAMCSRDDYLVDALWNDYDTHMVWTKRFVEIYPECIGGKKYAKDKKVLKKLRQWVKNKMVFAAFFGATNETVAGHLGYPQDIVDRVMDEFWDTFSGVKKWQERYLKSYYETGYVESPTGRRHWYPLTKSQIVNFPIQGVAADIVCDAMSRLSHHAASTEQWHLHPRLNIHDDLTFILPDDDKVIEESIDVISKMMLSPPYDFVNVPLSIELSIGPNWADQDDLGKMWSHKDI